MTCEADGLPVVNFGAEIGWYEAGGPHDVARACIYSLRTTSIYLGYILTTILATHFNSLNLGLPVWNLTSHFDE